MKCFWCGEEIDDNSTKCKFCGINIDKEAIEKRRLAREKDIKEFSLLGTIGLVFSMIPIGYFMQPLLLIEGSDNHNNFMAIAFSIIIILSFLCSVIGTVTAKIKNYDSTKIIMYSLGIIINGFWLILLIFDSTGLRIFAIIVISFFTFISNKLSPSEDEIMLKREKRKKKMYKKNNKMDNNNM